MATYQILRVGVAPALVSCPDYAIPLVRNAGPGNVYYGGPDVSPTNCQGWISPGQSTETQYSYFASNTRARLHVTIPDRYETLSGRIDGVEAGVGTQGPTGPAGPKGDTGTTGAQGNVGATGNTGATGPQGTAGLTGPKGDTGNTGPQGVKGDTGAQGIQGNAGSQGIQGPQGTTGPQGPSGVSWVYAGRQVLDLPNSNASFVNTDLIFSFAANGIYAVDLYLIATAALATAGFRFALDTSVAVTTAALSFTHVLANTGTVTAGHSIADATATGLSSGIPTAGAVTPIIGSGLLVAGANAGTARLVFGPEVAASATFKAGSAMRVHQIA